MWTELKHFVHPILGPMWRNSSALSLSHPRGHLPSYTYRLWTSVFVWFTLWVVVIIIILLISVCIPYMTYNVFGGMLNFTLSICLLISMCLWNWTFRCRCKADAQTWSTWCYWHHWLWHPWSCRQPCVSTEERCWFCYTPAAHHP